MTKKFEYTDGDGVKREAETFIASEFVTLSAPNSPVRTQANGFLHPSVIPPIVMGKAASLVIPRIASEPIFRGDVVRAIDTANNIAIADSNSTLVSAKALGVAINDAATGEEVEILILGIISDPIFGVFEANDPLFLDEAGGITNTRPTKETRNFLVPIGKSLGGNEILVNIESPVTLGA